MTAAITEPTPTGLTGALARVRRILTTNPSVLPTGAAVVIFVGMVVYGEVAYGRILQFSTLSNLLINNAHLIVLAVAMTFVILTGGIDLSVGSVIALSSVAGVMLANAGWNPVAVLVAMILIGTLSGLASGVLVHHFNVQPFIATLAMMFLGRGIASLLSTKPERLADDSVIRWFGTQFKVIDGPKVNDLVVTPGVIIAVVVVLAALFALHRTRTGRTVYALGGSETSTLLMGLPAARTKILVYVISGTLAGIAAVIYTSRLGIAQNITGVGWELDAIAAVFIGGAAVSGGIGTIVGSIIGGLVIAVLNNGLQLMSVGADLVQMIKGLVLLVAVGIDVYSKRQGKPSIIGLLMRSRKSPLDDEQTPAAPQGTKTPTAS